MESKDLRTIISLQGFKVRRSFDACVLWFDCHRQSKFAVGRTIHGGRLFKGNYMKNTRKMVQASLFASLTAICAWLSIPIPPISVTMQTFAVFLTLGVLGGKWGTVSVLLYLLLGLVGLPVFTGFRGGAAALLDATGGFLWGFLAAALVYWCLERLGRLPAMGIAMLVCYACGCAWFTVYAGGVGFAGAVMTCVVPYLIPDAVKIGLAYTMSGRIRKHLK